MSDLPSRLPARHCCNCYPVCEIPALHAQTASGKPYSIYHFNSNFASKFVLLEFCT